MEREILSCKNPSEHGDKWLLTVTKEKNEILPCFACCTLSLEDKEELVLRKKMILTFFRDLIESNTHILINTIASNDQIVFHTVQVFLNLLGYNDERFLKLTGECLLLFLIHMKKEGLSLAVMERLTIEIEEDCNYARSLPHMHVLGRLFQVFPELVQTGTCTKCKFLHILANGLNYPVEKVKNASLNLLLQIYQNLGGKAVISKSLDTAFVKSFLRILKYSQNKDLLENALSLLHLFISKKRITNFNILFNSSPDETSFTDIIKKILLSNETKFQVCMVQCICHILSNNLSFEKQIILLLEANIPEILFDVLSTKNELLLESVLCCLLLFVQNAKDATKNRFLFGVGIIIEVCHSLLSLKNWQLFCTTLNLLTSIITSNDYLLTSSHLAFYYQSTQLTERAFKVQNPAIQFAVCKYFSEFLKNKDLPLALPSEQIFRNINLCLRSQKKSISNLTVFEQMKEKTGSSKSFPIEMKILLCSLDMISSCIRLFKQYSSCPISVEKRYSCPNTVINNESSSPFHGKSHFMILCLSAMDEIFIPCCLQLKSTGIGGIIWYHLIQVLVVIFEENETSSLIYQFARKLVRAGFLKHFFDLKANKIPLNECDSEQVKRICNNGVKGLLKCILNTKNDTDAYLKMLESGLADLNDSLEECVNVLSQKSDVADRAAEFWASSSQIAMLCLCYLSYKNEALYVHMNV